MIGFIVNRFLLALITIWVVTVISFALIQLPPGDYITSYVAQLMSQGEQVSDQEAAQLRQQYGLGDPFVVQYYKWLEKAAVGNFGISMEYQRPVTQVIGDRIFLTAALAFSAALFTYALAVPIGVISAVKQYSITDYVATFIGFLGLAVPNFLLALSILYFGFVLFDANIGGLFSPEYASAPYSFGKIMNLLSHLWLPALVLSIAGTAQIIRVLRANMLDELRRPYVVTARAKGLSEWRVILKYPLRVALNPVISTLGYLLPTLVSGSIIVSIVMSLPTLGPLLLRALIAQDMFLSGTIVLLIGIMTVIGTFVSDLLLAWVDPRIRMEGS
jgi:peptide/nickel transport system permease protein|tara:strand:- start:2464 stop:3453 length:990 start_codon:yes stop_codon:yes gene_type:complete